MSDQVVVWGTYDICKPRVRIALEALKRLDREVIEIHAPVWSGIEDKSQIRGAGKKLMLVLGWLGKYPGLVRRFLRAPNDALVIVPYLGHFDVLVLYPFAKMRGMTVVWDAFISLYGTIVEDRELISRRNPVAWVIYAFEWLATRAVDLVILDTNAHAQYFKQRFGLSDRDLATVFVGVEQERFPLLEPIDEKPAGEPLTVLFYGQFIPLHGIPTIVEAASKLDDGSVSWVLIGSGQEQAKVESMLSANPVRHLTWIPWVEYEELIEWISRSDLCLGIFSDSEKAGRVIPNKLFQVLSAGRPLVTRDSSAIHELFSDREEGIYLVPPADSGALVETIRLFARERAKYISRPLYESVRCRIGVEGISRQIQEHVFNGLANDITP